MLAFVEGALERTNPGKAFTVGVLAALPMLPVSVKAAALGASVAKGGATVKAAGLMGLLGALMGAFIGFFGTWVGYKMSLASAPSDREREYIKSFYRKLTLCILGFFVLFGALMLNARAISNNNVPLFTTLVITLAVSYGVAILVLTVWSLRQRRRIRAEISGNDPPKFGDRPVFEYRSKLEIGGWPLVNIRIGGGVNAQRKAVKGWFAAGDCAIGLVFAFGGFAIAPISIGGCAIGLLPWGGAALGVLAAGGLSVGVWSFGGLAIGWQALGGCAVAWSAALGGVAMAHDFALGGIAHAAQANNSFAEQFILPVPFFHYGALTTHYMAWLNLIWMVPLLCWWWMITRAKRRELKPAT